MPDPRIEDQDGYPGSVKVTPPTSPVEASKSPNPTWVDELKIKPEPQT